MIRTRLMTTAAVVVALIVGLAGLCRTPAIANPGSGNVTGGQCTLVNLRLYTGLSGLRIQAVPGATCAEFDNEAGLFHRTGGLRVDGPVIRCDPATLEIEAVVTFEPASRTFDPYTSIHLTLTPGPGTNAVAAVLKSSGTPPHFAGAGALTAAAGNTCAAATWSQGSIGYEDPVVAPPA